MRRQHLRDTYGAKDGEAMFDRVRRYAVAHLPLHKVLREHGLGSRPELMADIAAHVFRTGWK